MNYRDALASVSAGSDRDAIKYQSWGGYIHKTTAGLSTADVAAGKHKLIWVQRDGDQFVFTWNGTNAYAYAGSVAKGQSGAKGTGEPAAATPLPLDADVQTALAGENWIAGSLAEFEAARNGSGEW